MRRGRSPTRYEDATNADIDIDVDVDVDVDADSMMDEDDQRELVETLQREAAAQTRFFQKVFGYGIGGMAMVLSLVFPLLCPDECGVDRETARACWIHSVLSFAVHARTLLPFLSEPSASKLVSTSKATSKATSTATSTATATSFTIPDAVDVLSQAVPILIWWGGLFSTHDEDHFHLALLIGNFVTFVGARLMHWDMRATERALEDLDGARYKHKSL